MAETETFLWNNDLIFKLIDLYHNRPVLWDNNLNEYKDKTKKVEAWHEIATGMGTDKEVVERKIKILSTQFRREIVKNENDDSKWFAYKKLLFLKPRVLKALSETESNAYVRSSHSQQSSSTSFGIRTTKQSGDVSSPSHSIKDDEASSSSIAGTSQISMKRCRVSETESEETRIEEMYRLVSELYRDRCSKDEFTVFGEHVAMKLRRLDNLYARCTAQYHINNILYKAEIGEYDWLEDSKPNLS